MSNKITYTYWIIYILPTYINLTKVSTFSDLNYIYAYTDEKELVDNFILFHDMNKFKIKKYKLTKEEVHKLNMGNMYRYLVGRTLSTSLDSEGIKLAMSIEEENLLNDTITSIYMKINQMWNLFTFSLNINGIKMFKKKYRKLLEKVKFDKMIDKDEKYYFNELIDEFAVYCYLYKDLLNEKEGK